MRTSLSGKFECVSVFKYCSPSTTVYQSQLLSACLNYCLPSTNICPQLLSACCPSVSLYEDLAAMSSEQLSAYAVSLRAMGLGALAQQWHGTLVLSLPLQIWTPNVQTFQLSVLTGKCATSDLNYCLPFVFLSVTTIVIIAVLSACLNNSS